MKKYSLIVAILLVAASIGMTAVFSSQVSINGFLLSVYSTAFGNSQTQRVDAQTSGIGTTITADIVDGNGNFVRALTTPETQSVSFDIQHSVPTTGGSVDSHSGNFDTQVSSGKLNTSYSLTTYVHSGSILTNIKPPSGYIVRSIEAGPWGTYFDPDSVNNNVTIHFTQLPASSQVQSVDQMLYVPNGISYVKKIAQTYSDNEYKYSDLDVDMFAYYNNNNRPFPLNWTVAKYSGVPYLFMNGTGKIVVYNISDPANPKQVSEFILSGLDDFNKITGAGDVTYGQCDPQNGGTHAFITSAENIYALDNSPYLLVSISSTLAPGGVAVLSINTSDMSLTAYPQRTLCNFPNGGQTPPGTAFGMYKGSDGNTYFVAQPFDDSVAGLGNPTIGILTVNSAGVFSKVATLYKYGLSGSASDLDYVHGEVSIVTVGNKTYLIGPAVSTVSKPSDLPVYIYDISDPKNIVKINQNIVTTGRIIIDKQTDRMYIASSVMNPIWQVYDLSVLPSAPKQIATYSKPTDILSSDQLSADFSEVAKRLRITSSENLMNINNSAFGYSTFTVSSIQLINVSGNLAYMALYSNGKNPWDTIANQAGKTDGSEYGTNIIQFVVDLTNAAQPKILGMIFGHTEYTPYAISAGGWFDVPVHGSIFDYNGYIYRANFRIADVWKLGNPPATTVSTPPVYTSSITPTTFSTSQSMFSFQSLLNIFKRILNNN
jgi:hypothetical protein